MRARRRRSVLNTVSAAALEVAIMGIFVIIAQPQLRDALFEILQVDPSVSQVATSPGSTSRGPQANGLHAGIDRETVDQAVQAVLSSPVAKAVENKIVDWTTPQSHNEISTDQTTLSAPSLLSSTASSSAGSRLRDQPVFTPAPTASPYQQYESFRVSVPTNDQVAGRPQYAVPQYVAPQNYGTYNTYQNQGALGTASGLPTQLTANQWNIASAPQSPRAFVQPTPNSNQLYPAHATETSYRQVYPPPYGTQGMWK